MYANKNDLMESSINAERETDMQRNKYADFFG